MISGQIVPEAAIGDYMGFEAAHIFPQARLTEWIGRGFQNSITDQSDLRLISSTPRRMAFCFTIDKRG
jgi:hypothetical protein